MPVRITARFARGLCLGPACFNKLRTSFLDALAVPQWLSFLMPAVVAGIGKTWHVEFYRVAAFVASGEKATKDETAQTEHKAAHLSSPGLARLLTRLSSMIQKLYNFFKIML
ncbi:MAG TPA: hypothetical protein VL996_08975 [Methylocella sp.]|nr:hypothetical protein [Methylocella sp.]